MPARHEAGTSQRERQPSGRALPLVLVHGCLPDGRSWRKQATARPKVIDAMLAKYPAHGNRYTLFVAAFSQFPS